MALVFVFGSNTAGRHGKGAALFAVQKYGAVYGQGFGRQGNSFAIPTKDGTLRSMNLDDIAVGLEKFVEYAWETPDDTFMLTPIGCGLAGHKREDIYKLLRKFELPSNVLLTKEWLNL